MRSSLWSMNHADCLSTLVGLFDLQISETGSCTRLTQAIPLDPRSCGTAVEQRCLKNHLIWARSHRPSPALRAGNVQACHSAVKPRWKCLLSISGRSTIGNEPWTWPLWKSRRRRDIPLSEKPSSINGSPRHTISSLHLTYNEQ